MSMDIKTFEVNPLGENCYVVSDETKEAVIIDCGCSTESEWADIKKEQHNAVPNGIIALKGGELAAEIASMKNIATVWELSEFFDEE